MAATATFTGDDISQFGNIPVRFANLTLDASYPAGGYAINGGLFGGASTGGGQASNNGLRGLDVIGSNTAAGGYVYSYNSQTGKMQVFWTGAVVSTQLAEVTAATNLSTTVINVIAYLAGE
jgi:hypothetical protein